MTEETIRAFTRAQPFKSFRVTLTNGELFQIGWPDECVTGSGMVFIPRACCLGACDGFGLIAHIPLDQVTRLDHLPEADEFITA